MSKHYIPLIEYSTKYKVSISTLRRRIKAEDIQFLFEDGKYLIADQPMSTHTKLHRPSPKNSEGTLVSAHNGSSQISKKTIEAFELPEALSGKVDLNSERLMSIKKDEPLLSAANRLLSELKRAYTQILQEKEEQILHLREEVTDLKTLVKVLESENVRVRNPLQQFS